MQNSDQVVIEAYVPERLARQLVVGATVRIRITGECNQEWHDTSHATLCYGNGHYQFIDGMIGTIGSLADDAPNHPYVVYFHTPYFCPKCGNVMSGEAFAAAELEPVTLGPTLP